MDHKVKKVLIQRVVMVIMALLAGSCATDAQFRQEMLYCFGLCVWTEQEAESGNEYEGYQQWEFRVPKPDDFIEVPEK